MANITAHRFTYLLITLVVMIAVAPLLNEFTYLRITFDLALSMILIAGLFVVSQHKILPWFAALLAIPMLVSIWLRYFDQVWPVIDLVGKVSGIFYFATIAAAIITFVFCTHRVTWELISAALVGYLLLGTMWGFCYAVIELIQSGSFQITQCAAGCKDAGFFYYSFITLTTVGYGDITPLTGISRSFSMLEGIVGQCYMAVLVARLVGLHVAEAGQKSSPDND